MNVNSTDFGHILEMLGFPYCFSIVTDNICLLLKANLLHKCASDILFTLRIPFHLLFRSSGYNLIFSYFTNKENIYIYKTANPPLGLEMYDLIFLVQKGNS